MSGSLERDISAHFGKTYNYEWLRTAEPIKYIRKGNRIFAYREGYGLNGSRNYLIFGGVADTRNPCFTVAIDPDKTTNGREAILHTVRRASDCFIRGTESSREMVRIAVYMAKSRGATSLFLTDDSRIQCPERVPLAPLSFLTHGMTWYESIIPGLKAVDLPDLEAWRQKALTNTWAEVAARAEQNPLVGAAVWDLETGDFDIEEPGSAMAVLAKAKLDRTRCRWFSRYIDGILTASGIGRLDGTDWRTDLTQINEPSYMRTVLDIGTGSRTPA